MLVSLNYVFDESPQFNHLSLPTVSIVWEVAVQPTLELLRKEYRDIVQSAIPILLSKDRHGQIAITTVDFNTLFRIDLYILLSFLQPVDGLAKIATIGFAHFRLRA